MQQFELLYIIPAKLEEANKQQVMERVSKLVTDNQGKIQDHNIWLTRKLSYPINHIRQGIFLMAHFNLPAQQINLLRKELTIDEDILRHLLLKVVEPKNKKRAITKPSRILPLTTQPDIQLPQAAKEPVPASDQPEVAEKVSLEELDKKLEELLSDKPEVKWIKNYELRIKNKVDQAQAK